MLTNITAKQANDLSMQIDMIMRSNPSLPSKVHSVLWKNKRTLQEVLSPESAKMQSLLKEFGGELAVKEDGKTNFIKFNDIEQEKKYYEKFNEMLSREVNVALIALTSYDINDIRIPSQLPYTEFYHLIIKDENQVLKKVQ